MAGVRILCNTVIPVTDWNHEYVTIKSKLESGSPLPTLACFDLLNPLDNSRHGYRVNPRGGQVRDWGLHYDNNAVPSTTDFIRPNTNAVSFITAFKLDRKDRYINILNNRGPAKGFNLYYSGGLYMSYLYPSGRPGTISAAGAVDVDVDTWYVAAGAFDSVSKTASFMVGDKLQYGTIGTGYPEGAVLAANMHIGGGLDLSTTSSMAGDIAFAAFYDGAFTVEQRAAAVALGRQVLRDRNLN